MELKVGELLRHFVVDFHGTNYTVFTSVGGGIGLEYEDNLKNMKFVFYTGKEKNQIFDIYPNCSDNYTVYSSDIEEVNEPSVYLDDKLKKQIDQEQEFYIIQNGFFSHIEDSDFIQIAKKEFNKLSNNIGGYISRQVPKELYKFGENLTEKKYYANPAISREAEIELVELGLVTPKKSPLLVGFPGVGKTAIAEGLAYRIQKGDVPVALQNKIIFNIEAASLINGCQYRGMLEKNVKTLVEAVKNRDDIVMFIDEFHTLIGLGKTDGVNIDVSNILKPYLANGEIKIIGATTLEEYNKIVLKDKAFARRFKLVDVPEPEIDVVVKILLGSIPYYEQVTDVKFSFCDEDKKIIFENLALLTMRENRTQEKYYPDITLEILADSFGLARLNSRDDVIIDDIVKAISICNTVNKDSKDAIIESLKATFARKKLELKPKSGDTV